MATDRDLFAGFERMRREMDELFGDVFDRALAPRRAGFAPRVDVYYTQSPPAAVIAIDLAGITVEELTVDVQGRIVRIAGRRPPVIAAGRVYQQLEIEHGPF
jgi:HSP20 family protein